MCLDYIGPITNASPFALPAGESFTVAFEQGAPTETSESWIRFPAGSKPFAVGLDGATWSIDPSTFVPSPTPGTVPPGLAPGEYIYVVQGFWHNQGDVMYGFWLELK